MFGHDWEPATATIVAKKYHEESSNSGTWEFVADVAPATGPPFRAKLKQPRLMSRMMELDEGASVPVLADVKRQKAKFDRDQAKTIGRPVPFQKDRFDETLEQAPGTPGTPEPGDP